jgi:hypothetical protein
MDAAFMLPGCGVVSQATAIGEVIIGKRGLLG